jgi:hypothetical protein
LGQVQSLAGELVETWCRRTAQLAASITPEIAVPDIISQNEYDVRLARTHWDCSFLSLETNIDVPLELLLKRCGSITAAKEIANTNDEF